MARRFLRPVPADLEVDVVVDAVMDVTVDLVMFPGWRSPVGRVAALVSKPKLKPKPVVGEWDPGASASALGELCYSGAMLPRCPGALRGSSARSVGDDPGS